MVSGVWITSVFTGVYHYHTRGHTVGGDSDKLSSACHVHKISLTKFEWVDKFSLDDIPRPDRICRDCLIRTKKKINIFNYITDLEKELDGFEKTLDYLETQVDFVSKIPNIEVEAN